MRAACMGCNWKCNHLLLYCTPLAKRLWRLWFIDCRPAGIFFSLSCPPSEPTSFLRAENILTRISVQFPLENSKFKVLLQSALELMGQQSSFRNWRLRFANRFIMNTLLWGCRPGSRSEVTDSQNLELYCNVGSLLRGELAARSIHQCILIRTAIALCQITVLIHCRSSWHHLYEEKNIT